MSGTPSSPRFFTFPGHPHPPGTRLDLDRSRTPCGTRQGPRGPAHRVDFPTGTRGKRTEGPGLRSLLGSLLSRTTHTHPESQTDEVLLPPPVTEDGLPTSVPPRRPVLLGGPCLVVLTVTGLPWSSACRRSLYGVSPALVSVKDLQFWTSVPVTTVPRTTPVPVLVPYEGAPTTPCPARRVTHPWVPPRFGPTGGFRPKQVFLSSVPRGRRWKEPTEQVTSLSSDTRPPRNSLDPPGTPCVP